MHFMKSSRASASAGVRSALLPPDMPQVVLAAFEGPLDLLLQLIRANRVEITDIPIVEITNQYLAALAQMETLNLAIAGEYLVMAATLIEIKSRMLLPLPPSVTEEEGYDPRAELIERLQEYDRYLETSVLLREWEEIRRDIYFRAAEECTDSYPLQVLHNQASPMLLFRALQRLLTEAGLDDKPVTTIIPKRRVSLRMKMAEIIRRLHTAGKQGIQFETLFDLPCPRHDIVIAFLAILELLNLGRLTASQDEPGDAILLYEETMG